MIERDEMELPEWVVQGGADAPEREFEVGLRPQSLSDFVGQQALKDNLNIVIQAAKQRGRAKHDGSVSAKSHT